MPTGTYKRKNYETRPKKIDYSKENLKLQIDRFVIMEDYLALERASRIISKFKRESYKTRNN